MFYKEFEVGNDTYKLRLTTKGIISLENRLGRSPLEMLMDIERGMFPRVEDIVIVLHSMLVELQSNIKTDAVYDIIDKYIEDGNTIMDIIPTFIEVFQNCGYLAKPAEEDEKN